MKLIKYTKYLFEIIAIFIGITLSLMADEWRDKKQNREETVKALKMIREDLVADTVKFSDFIGYYDYIKDIYDLQYYHIKRINDFDSIQNLYFASSSFHYARKLGRTGISAFENLQNRVLSFADTQKKLGEYYSNPFFDGANESYSKYVFEVMYRQGEKANFYRDKVLTRSQKQKVRSLYRFITESQYWHLQDSTDYNLTLAKEYIIDIKNYMQSNEYKNNVRIKQGHESLVLSASYHFNNMATELISILDKELNQ